MNRYKVTVAYDGSNYKGWQVQPGKLSIQKVIEEAFSTLYKRKITIIASGRTDAKVHALGQVFHYDCIQDIPPVRLIKGINSLLPKDIRIRNIELVTADFHARYLALSKIYEYRVNLGEYNLFQKDYCYQLNKEVDLKLIEAAIQLFLGEHDFTSFNTTTLKENYNQIRTIEEFNFKVEDNILVFTIRGDGFLRYMIRMIIGTILQVGLKKVTIELVRDILEKKEKGTCRYKAPPVGLYLKEVQY